MADRSSISIPFTLRSHLSAIAMLAQHWASFHRPSLSFISSSLRSIQPFLHKTV